MIDSVREGLVDVPLRSEQLEKIGNRVGKGYMICSKRKFRVDILANDVKTNESTPAVSNPQVLEECTKVSEKSVSELEKPICGGAQQQDEAGNGAPKKRRFNSAGSSPTTGMPDGIHHRLPDE